MNMRNAILFLVVLTGILQPTRNFATGVLDTKTAKNIHYDNEISISSLSNYGEELSISFSPTHLSCKNQNDGKLTAHVSGGKSPYEYAWNTGATTASIDHLAAGIYRVTVTDAKGRTKEAATKITEPEFSVRVVIPGKICFGEYAAQLSTEITGGVAPFVYEWNTGHPTPQLNNVPQGTYSVTVTGANGCTAVDEARVLSFKEVEIWETITHVSCPNGADGRIKASAKGGSSSHFSYAWSDGQVGNIASNLQAGTYTVSVTELATGCIITKDITVNEPSPILIQPTVTNASSENAADGTASVQVMGGTPPYTYEWSNGATTATISNIPFGTYTVKVTDANGCMETISIMIDPDCTMEVQLHPDAISCQGNDGSITAQTINTNQAVTYEWSNGQTGSTIANLAPGMYGVTATNAIGCIAVGSITLRDNKILFGDDASEGDFIVPDTVFENSTGGNIIRTTFIDCSFIEIQQISCHGAADGQISVIAKGGTESGVSYLWSNGIPDQTINNLAPGVYTVTVTDNETGCSITRKVALSEPDPLALQPTITNASTESTADGSISVQVTGGTPPYTYEWSNGAITPAIGNVPFGTYTVKVTDANGCMETTTVIIEPNCTIGVSLTPVAISCRGNDGSISAIPTRNKGTVTYRWSTGQTGQTIANLSPGTYSVTATDAVGCTAVASTTLKDNQIILGDGTATTGTFENGSSIIVQSVSCHNGSDGQISVTAQGGTGSGLSYSWSTGQMGQTITNLPAGTYTVSVTDDATACTITRDIIVTEPSPIVIQPTVTNASDESTADGAISLQVIGGTPPYTYEWSNGATTATINNLTFGTYTVKVTDANGCMETITVTVDPDCTINSQLFPTAITCLGNDGSLVAEVSGTTETLTYSWSNGQTGRSIINLSPGTYSVTVTDAAGCTTSASATLEDNQIIIDVNSITTNSATCHGTATGQATVAARGGTGGELAYTWSNGQTGPTATNLAAGTYTVSVVDLATNCTVTQEVVITEPSPINIQPTITNAMTETSQDGAITIQVTGGTPSYSYQWSNGATTATISNIAVGTYSVTITDANGCQAIENITVQANCLLTATVSSTPTSCTGNDGTISFLVSNANGTLTYNWSNGSIGQTISGLGIGFYSVTATDELGCTITSGGFVEDGCTCTPPQITSVAIIEATGQAAADGSIALTVRGGNNRYNFQWSNGETSPAIIGLIPASYTVTISDLTEPSCNLVRNILVGNSTIKIGPAEVTSITDSECGLNNGAAELFPSGLNYQWSDGGTGAARTNLAPGTYTVTATFDQFPGEVDIVEIVIKTIGGLDASAEVTQMPDCGTNNGTAVITATKGSGNYTYSWGPSNTRNDLTSGTYSVTVTDQIYGCEEIVTFVVTDNVPSATVELINIQPVSCNGGTNGIAQYNILLTNEVAQPVTQRITDGLGNSYNPTNLPAGQYCLEIFDGNNCVAGGACFEITEPDELFVEVSRTPVICSANGIMIVKARGGNGNYMFDWADLDGTNNTASRGNVPPGTYAINVSDSKGCTVSIDNIFMAEPQVPTVSLDVTSPATLTSNDGSISVITEGGLPPFRYLWSTQDEGVSSIENLGPGDYSVTIVDANGCVEILDTSLQALCTFDITSNTENTSCTGNDGSIQLDITGGTGTIAYNWSNGATTNRITGLAPGPYSVTVSDQGACLYIETFTIANGCACEDPVIASIVTVKETIPNSNDGSITIEVVADNPQFTWSDPSLSGNQITGLSAGVYAVTISDGDCSTNTSIPVSNGNIPAIEVVSITNTPCGASTGSATLAPPNLSYSWSDGGTGNNRDNLAAGEYIVTATDPTQPGVSIEIITIKSEGGLNAFPVIDKLPDCGQSNGEVQITVVGGSGNVTYSWGTGNSRSNLPSGTYSVTVVDQDLGCEDVVQFTLLDNVPAVEVSTTTTRVTCAGDADGTVQVNLTPSTGANGPFTQTIMDGSGKVYENNMLAAGIYCVEVRDRDGCIAGSDCFTIMSPEPLIVVVTPTLSSCQDDGTLSLAISGGNGEYIVNWADLNGTSNPVNRTNLTEGTYSFEVTDRKGCKAAGAASIRKVTDPQVTTNGTNATNLTSNDGTAMATPSDGTAPYTFEWSNGATTQSIDNLPPGTYEVTITDANGCTATSSVEIIATCTLLIGEINFGQLPDCGASDGSVSIEVLNTTNARYSWGPTNSRTNLAAGDYAVTVTDDATGCTALASFTLPNRATSAKATVNPLEICEGARGTLVFNIERSACFESPMDILIQDAAGNTYNFDDIVAGNYTLTVLDANGTAITSEDFTVTTIPSFGISPSVNAVTCDELGAITLEAEGGNDNYTFNWSDIDGLNNDANRNDLTAGDYQVTITNNQTNCEQIRNFTIANEGLDITVNKEAFTCDGDPIQLSVINNKLSDNLVYTWMPADAILSGGNTGTPTVQVDSVQEFTYAIENQFGCSQSGSITVTSANTQPPGMIAQAQQCSGTVVNFKSSGGATEHYIWDFGDGTTSEEANPTHEYASPGNYTVTLRLDPNFPCAAGLGTITNQLVEVQDSVATEASFTTDFEPCEDEGLVTFRNTSNVSPGPVSYFWNFGNGMTSTEENPQIQLNQNIDLNISLTINTPFGCEDTARDNFEVEVFKRPTVFDSIQACAGVATELNPRPADDAFKYSWTPAEFLDNPTIANPMITVNRTTRVDVIIRDSVCEVKSSVLVVVPEEPDYTLVEDSAVCSSLDQLFFVASDAEGDILWSTEPTYSDTISTEPEFMAEPGIYYFRLTDTFNCTYEDEVEIANALLEAEIDSDLGLTICKNDGATLTVINTKPVFEIISYEWMDGPGVLNTDLNSTSLVVQPDTATEYSVIVTNEAGCMDTVSQVIEVSDIDAQIMVTASPDTVFISQSSVLEVTPPASTVIWMDDASAGPTRTVTPMVTTNYMVTLRDENGCEATDLVTVVVQNPVCAPPNIFFPNAFSPNGDGVNDMLRLRGNGIESAFWQIYNRWGELVFEANSIDDEWDGTFENKLVDPDVYGYVLRVECFSGDVYETQGNVTVLR